MLRTSRPRHQLPPPPPHPTLPLKPSRHSAVNPQTTYTPVPPGVFRLAERYCYNKSTPYRADCCTRPDTGRHWSGHRTLCSSTKLHRTDDQLTERAREKERESYCHLASNARTIAGTGWHAGVATNVIMTSSSSRKAALSF